MKKIVGPEKDPTKLIKALKKLSLQHATFSSDGIDDNANRRIMTPTLGKTIGQWKGYNRMNNSVKAKYFCDFVSRLKYILEAITMPKVVYLISEGIPEILSFGVTAGINHNIFFSPELHERIMKIAKEINEGGSMLYTVYSGRIKAAKGQSIAGMSKGSFGSTGSLEGAAAVFSESMSLPEDSMPFATDKGSGSLQNMAIASKGKYFEGSAESIATEIKQATAAYYELAFFPKGRKSMKIDLKCLRKGVTISTLGHTSVRQPYAEMNKIRKKVFAMNVVLERDWALAMCKFEKAPFRLLDEKQVQNVRAAEFLTGKLQDRRVEQFLIRFDKELKNADVKFSRETLKDKAALEFKNVKETDKLFFMIIDHETTQCAYNRIM